MSKGRYNKVLDSEYDKMLQSYTHGTFDPAYELRKMRSPMKDYDPFDTSFNSNNQDELGGDENPHTYRGGLNPYDSDPFNDIRASNQSGWEQAGIGLTRAGLKAGGEVVKLVGVAGGLLAAPFAEEGKGYDVAFNNPWIQSVDKFTDYVNSDLLPVYTKNSVKNGNLLENISSTSFWATEGADGLGFMIGMMAPGAILNKLSFGAKVLSASRKASQIMNISKKTEAAVGVLKGLGLTTKGATTMAGAVVNTIAESGSSAISASHEFEQEKPLFMKNAIPKAIAQLDPKGNIPQYIPGTEQIDADGNIIDAIENPEYTKLKEKATEIAEGQFTEQRALLQRDVFKANLAILILPNIFMSKALFGKAKPRYIVDNAKDSFMKVAGKRVANAAERWGGAIGSEAVVEEGGQTAASELFKEKAMNQELKRGGKSWDGGFITGGLEDFNIPEAVSAYVDMTTTVEGQKAMLLGGIMAGPMVSYQGRKEDVANFAESRRVEKILSNVNNNVASFNTIFENDIYMKDSDGNFIKEISPVTGKEEKVINIPKAKEVVKSLGLKEEESKILDKAIEEGDSDTVEMIKEKAMFDLIAPAVFEGDMGLEALKEILINNESYIDPHARAVAQGNIPTDTHSQTVDDVLKLAKELQKEGEKFRDFGDSLIKLDDPNATENDKKNFVNLLSQRYTYTKYLKKNAENRKNRLVKQNEMVMKELAEDPDSPSNASFLEKLRSKVGIVEEELNKKEAKYLESIRSNAIINENNEKIKSLEEDIDYYKDSVNEMWSSGKLNEGGKVENMTMKTAFADYVSKKGDKKAAEDLKEVERLTSVVASIKDPKVTSEAELKKTFAALSVEDRKNPYISSTYYDRLKEIRKAKQEEDDAKRKEQEEEELRKKQEEEAKNKSNGTQNNPPTGTGNNPLNSESESGLDPENPDVEIDLDTDEYVYDEMEEDVETPSENSHSGARVLSTIGISHLPGVDNSNVGKPLDTFFDGITEYERDSRDKRKDDVSFGLGQNVNNKPEIAEALSIFNEVLTGKGKDLSPEQVEILENYLPLTVTISNGSSKADSVLDDMSSKSANHRNNTQKHTLPLRKKIIANLIENKGNFGNMKGKIESQLPGRLSVEEGLDETPKNSIYDLDVFYGMTVEEIAEYVQKNTFYVDHKGRLINTVNKSVKKASFGARHSGKLFLRIDAANGTDFYMKLNISSIDENTANDLFELMLLQVNNFAVAGSKKAISVEDLGNLIKTPYLQRHIEKVKSLDQNIAKTVANLIDLLILNGNANHVTKFNIFFDKVTGKTGVELGSLFWDKSLGVKAPSNMVLTSEELLANPEAFRSAFVKFFGYKRHNLLVKNPYFNFRDIDYIRYLLDKDMQGNKILSTNAEVNRMSSDRKLVGSRNPTFKGYTNIFLEPNIYKRQGTSKTKAELDAEALAAAANNKKIKPTIKKTVKVKDIIVGATFEYKGKGAEITKVEGEFIVFKVDDVEDSFIDFEEFERKTGIKVKFDVIKHSNRVQKIIDDNKLTEAEVESIPKNGKNDTILVKDINNFILMKKARENKLETVSLEDEIPDNATPEQLRQIIINMYNDKATRAKIGAYYFTKKGKLTSDPEVVADHIVKYIKPEELRTIKRNCQ